jgi:hypothetical protein
MKVLPLIAVLGAGDRCTHPGDRLGYPTIRSTHDSKIFLQTITIHEVVIDCLESWARSTGLGA